MVGGAFCEPPVNVVRISWAQYRVVGDCTLAVLKRPEWACQARTVVAGIYSQCASSNKEAAET